MKRAPKQQSKAPQYPRRGEEGAELLRKLVPDRWKKGKAVTGALALLFFPAHGGAADAKKADPTQPPPMLSQIFEHGEGRGAFGCVAVSPPAFLTEADARQVIIEEFSKVGVKFELQKHTLPGVVESSRQETWKHTNGKVEIEESAKKPGGIAVLDGYDPAHQIGFEYISEDDYFRFGGARSNSTVQAYDLKKAASELVKEGAKNGKGTLGVFYDPMVRPNYKNHSEWKAGAKEQGQAELRAQVRDFIAWLKTRGVL
jgi:hypothetical protein